MKKSKKSGSIFSPNRMPVLLCLALALVLNVFAAPGYAADSATASDMRLEKTEGAVTVINNSGKEISAREGMKLYNAWSVNTGDDGYAYINLDSSKIIKLDANSKAELSKDGEKLELTLSAGQLFFNVTEPLKETETLNIRTSTMVTGIRGTSGYVAVLENGESSVSILDGQVELSRVGSDGSESLSAGQTAVSAGNEVIIETMNEEDIPAFVAAVLAEDEQLRLRVEAELPFSLESIPAELSSGSGIVWVDAPLPEEFIAQQAAPPSAMPSP